MRCPTRLIIRAGLFFLAACATTQPGAESADGGLTAEAELAAVARSLHELERAHQAALVGLDDALWQHWLDGGTWTPPPAPKSPASDRLALTRRASELGLDAGTLERALISQALQRQVAELDADTATISATLTFSFDGREVPLRELPRMLSNEPSAVKRKALWAASEPAAQKESAALQRRDLARLQALEALDAGTEAEWALGTWGLQAEEAKRLATTLLDDSDEASKAAVALLGAATGTTTFTRADWPRLLKVPPALDAPFGKAELVKLVEAHRSAHPNAKLLWLVGEQQPALPLALPQRPGRPARLSYRPVGGLLNLQHLLSLVGASLAAPAAPESPEGARKTMAWSQRYAQLAEQEAYLTWAGVDAALAPKIAELARAQRLLQLRRAAAIMLLRLEADEPSERDARWAALATRAMRVEHHGKDGARWPSETQGFTRAIGEVWGELEARSKALEEKWWAGKKP